MSPPIVPIPAVERLNAPVPPPVKGIETLYVSKFNVEALHVAVYVPKAKGHAAVPNHVVYILTPSTVMFCVAENWRK